MGANANAQTLIQLVEGAARSLTAEIEDVTRPFPFSDELRDAVHEMLENRIGPAVSDVLKMLADAMKDIGE